MKLVPSIDKIHYKQLYLILFTILCLGVFLSVSPANAVKRAQTTDKAQREYRLAKNKYDQLARSPRLRKSRRVWERVIQRFRRVYLKYPDHPSVAPKALYMMARCYRGLYGYSMKKRDLRNAIERNNVLLERFPSHHLADDAMYSNGEMYMWLGDKTKAARFFQRVVEEYPDGDHVKAAKRKLRTLKAYVKKPKKKRKSNQVALVENIRYWSDSDYTRVVIDTSGPVEYKKGYLSKPRRFFLDLYPAKKKSGIKPKVPLDGGLLKSVRLGQFSENTVRIVFDLGKAQGTKVFNLEDPFRVVVDAFGIGYSAGDSCPPPPPSRPQKNVKSGKKRNGNGLSLAQQLGLCVKKVVIDAGHGGKDPGAKGPTGLREKHVVLKVAKKVAQKLKKRLGCQVVLTRRSDRFLPLEQRTAIANARKADLFISIHANASRDRRARGIETYFLNFALDEKAMAVAARENATSTKRISELQNILKDIMKNTKINESARLARHIQNNLVGILKKRYRGIKNLGVKQAPFFVLIGARMPSVLVEISFISNRQEERHLKDDRYLDQIAEGIVRGIESYARDTQMAYLSLL